MFVTLVDTILNKETETNYNVYKFRLECARWLLTCNPCGLHDTSRTTTLKIKTITTFLKILLFAAS